MKDLPRENIQKYQAICAKAGLKPGALLDACTIDVAVLGPQAVASYRNRIASVPVLVGDAR